MAEDCRLPQLSGRPLRALSGLSIKKSRVCFRPILDKKTKDVDTGTTASLEILKAIYLTICL